MDDLILPIPPPAAFTSWVCRPAPQCPVYAMQEIKTCILFKIGMNSTNWAISPALFWILLHSVVSLSFIKKSKTSYSNPTYLYSLICPMFDHDPIITFAVCSKNRALDLELVKSLKTAEGWALQVSFQLMAQIMNWALSSLTRPVTIVTLILISKLHIYLDAVVCANNPNSSRDWSKRSTKFKAGLGNL